MIIEDLSHTVPSPTRYFNKLHRYATWRKMAVLQRPRNRGLPQCNARPRSQVKKQKQSYDSDEILGDTQNKNKFKSNSATTTTEEAIEQQEQVQNNMGEV